MSDGLVEEGITCLGRLEAEVELLKNGEREGKGGGTPGIISAGSEREAKEIWATATEKVEGVQGGGRGRGQGKGLQGGTMEGDQGEGEGEVRMGGYGAVMVELDTEIMGIEEGVELEVGETMETSKEAVEKEARFDLEGKGEAVGDGEESTASEGQRDPVLRVRQ